MDLKLIEITGLIFLVALSGCATPPTPNQINNFNADDFACTQRAILCEGQPDGEYAENQCSAVQGDLRCTTTQYVTCKIGLSTARRIALDEVQCAPLTMTQPPQTINEPTVSVGSSTATDLLNCDALLQPLAACSKLAEGKFVSLSPGETKELYADEMVSYPPIANGKGMCIWEYAEHPTQGEAQTIFANTRSTYVQMQLFNSAADAEYNFQGFKSGYPNAPMPSDNELITEETTSFSVGRAHIKLAGSAVIQISQSHGANVSDACTLAEENAILETFQAP